MTQNPDDRRQDLAEADGGSAGPKSPGNDVKRSLKTRHLSMIALGGSIGTGLFLACGEAVSGSGPGGALVAYVAIGGMVFFLMTSLGELATFAPLSGSFSMFSERFVDPALGFASGWNEFFSRAVTLAVEVLTAGLLIRFWLPDFPTWVWEVSVLVFVFLVNAFTVRSFGEVEFWMTIIKIVSIVVFIVIGLLRILGAVGEAVYLRNFVYRDAPFVGDFASFLSSATVAGFSFSGSEFVGIAAAESENPAKDIPAAVRQVFWRILLFYILSIFIIGALLPYDNPNLLGADGHSIVESPFTIVFLSAGIPAAPDIINAVVLLAVISSANSITYSECRMLYSLAGVGKAPAIFRRTFRSGIPFFALVGIIGVAAVVYVLSKVAEDVYLTLIAAVTVAGFLNWCTIGISHFRFRRAYVLQKGGKLDGLAYYAACFPFGPVIVMSVCLFMVVSHNAQNFIKGKWGDALISYSAVPLFAALYVGFKVAKKTRIIPLNEIRLETPPMREPLLGASGSGVGAAAHHSYVV
jgi:lysine-specific permease